MLNENLVDLSQCLLLLSKGLFSIGIASMCFKDFSQVSLALVDRSSIAMALMFSGVAWGSS